MMKKGASIDRGYATVTGDEGVNYREIAETLTEMGFPMNHSSVRNHIVRMMNRFAEALASAWDIPVSQDELPETAKNPTFQHGIADLLHQLEARRRVEHQVSPS